MKKLKVTIYIASYNYARYLQEAIESVLRQSFDSWELLLINDGSADNTQNIIELYKGDPRIMIFNTSNIGLPRVANFALKHANGEYIMRLDADDVLDENAVFVLSNYLDRNQEAVLVFPDFYLMDDSGGILGQERRQKIYHSNHLLDIPANGACTMIRKKILTKLGGYREDLGAQDGFDIWSRIIREYKCANVNLPLFYYRRHGNNLTEDYSRILGARREIKKDAGSAQLRKYNPIVTIIPCRKNYDIFPNLWSKKINSETLLDISIGKCVASKIINKIIITADDLKVRDYLSKFKDKRLMFVERSTKSTLNSTPLVYTLEHIVKKLKLKDNGIVSLLYIQAPFATTSNLEEAIYTLVMNNTDSAIAVEEVKDPLYKRTQHGLTSINTFGNLRSDFDTVYREIRTSLAARIHNLKTGSLTGPKIAHFVIPKEEAFYIETKRDFSIAKALSKQFNYAE